MAKILLVDDNDDVREMMAARLEGRGYQVVPAVDGQQAVDLASAEAPDVILMDLTLPLIDGWQATRQIKADQATRRIPIILLSAHNLTGREPEAQEAGADEYETKPVNFSRLVEKIETFLSRGQ